MKKLVNQPYLLSLFLLASALLMPIDVWGQGADPSNSFLFYLEQEASGAPIKTESYTVNFYDDKNLFPSLWNVNQLRVTYSSSTPSVATIDASSGSITLVGIGSTTITAEGQFATTSETATASYTLIVEDGRMEFSQGAFWGYDESESEESVSSVSVEYGSEPTLPGLQIGDLGNETFTYSSSESSVATIDSSTGAVAVVGVGSTTISASFAGNDWCKAGSVSYTLTVTPATVTVSGFTASNKTYDGTTTATLSGGTVTGLVGNDVVTATATGTFDDANVGTGKTVTISDITLAGAAGNYIIETSKSQTSTTADITAKALTVAAENKSKTYGDADPALTYTTTGLVGSDALAGALTRTAGDDVGSYNIAQGTLAASANYTLTFTGASLTISAKEAALSWSNTEFTYDGSAHVPTAMVSNLVGNDVCTVTVSGEQRETGEYTATATALSNSNYALPTSATQSFTITAATMTGVSASGFTGAYDGAAHGITVTAPDGATVKYGTAEGTYTLDASPTYTNAGTYTVYYQVTKANYTGVTGSQTVSISKAAGSISFATASVSKTFGDAAFTNALAKTGDGTVTYSSSDANVATVNAESGEVSIVGNGTATITATVADGANYTYATKSATYTVAVGAAIMTGISASGYTGTYDGAAHGITVKVPEGATVMFGTEKGVYTFDVSPTFTNAGTYTVFYIVTMRGYADISGSAEVIIKKAYGFVAFSESSAIATLGEPFTPPTLSVTPEDAEVIFVSSSPEVASVDAASGKVTLRSVGITRITATFGGDTNYEGDSHYYDLTVKASEMDPITKEEDYSMMDPGDFINPNGTEKNLGNTVINNILYTLKNQDSDEGDGYDPDLKAIVLNTYQGYNELMNLIRGNVMPCTQEFAEAFTGLTFLVPAGEGFIIVTSQEISGNQLMVKVGDKEPVAISMPEMGDYSIPYQSDTETWVYMWNGGQGSISNARAIMKGRKTMANIRVRNVAYKAKSSAPTGIQSVGLADEEARWYDLNGRRIEKLLKKGIYIRDGQKVVIR